MQQSYQLRRSPILPKRYEDFSAVLKQGLPVSLIDRFLGFLFDPTGRKRQSQEQRVSHSWQRQKRAIALIEEFRRTQLAIERRHQ